MSEVLERLQVTAGGYTLTLSDTFGAISVRDEATGCGAQVWLGTRDAEATRALIIAHERALQSLASLSAGITVEVSRKVWERDQARLGELEQENVMLRERLERIAGLGTNQEHESSRIAEAGPVRKGSSMPTEIETPAPTHPRRDKKARLLQKPGQDTGGHSAK